MHGSTIQPVEDHFLHILNIIDQVGNILKALKYLMQNCETEKAFILLLLETFV